MGNPICVSTIMGWKTYYLSLALSKRGNKLSTPATRRGIVTTPQGVVIPFKRDTGLTNEMPYIDMREHKEGFGMIQNVRKNFDNFTSKDIEKTNISCKTQLMVANQSDERFKEIMSVSSLKNFPVEVKDVSNSYTIFGANINMLRGAIIRHKPSRVKEEYMKITKGFYQLQMFLP